MDIKGREDDRVGSRGLFLATGVHTDGTREIRGHPLGDCESEETWERSFKSSNNVGYEE